MYWAAAAGIAGTALSAYGQYRAGDSAKKRAKFEAEQLEAKADEVLSVSQRQAIEQERQGRLAASRALAVAAASGGGATDPTVVDVMEDLAGEASYKKMSALYEGKQQASDLKLQAEATRETGEVAKESGKLSALGTALGGGASLYAKYGADSPWAKNLWHRASSGMAPGGPRRIR